MKHFSKVLLVLILLLTSVSLVSHASDFPDVPRDETELSKAIYTLHDAGIVGGYEDGCFRPNNLLTRAELCKIVNYIFGYNTPSAENFKDVKENDWFYHYVLIAKEAGYIKGFEDSTFRGTSTLTREQTCIVICRTAGLYDIPTSVEVKDPISDWAKNDVMKVIANYVMFVDSDGNFRAKENITRGELAMALDGFVTDPVTPEQPSAPPSSPSTPTLPSAPVGKYTVRFYNGDGSLMSKQTVDGGNAATPPEKIPTKADDKEWKYLSFTGWNKDFSRVTSNMDIYPVFEKKAIEYKVTLNYGLGTTGTMPSSITVTYNELLAPRLPTTDFENGDKYFAGWYVGSELIDTERYSDLRHTTLTAKWVSDFTVNFYNGDGSLMKTQKVKYNTSATPPTKEPTKSEDNEWTYDKFIGWDKDYTNVTSNLDIYPEFQKSAKKYSVVLDYNATDFSGEALPFITLTYNEKILPKLPVDLTHPDKIFLGWYDGEELIDDEVFSDLSSKTITAMWQDIIYTVTFYDGDGSVMKKEEVASGKTATAPTKLPQKDKDERYTYTFDGWDKSFTSVRSNLDVNPKFKPTARLYTINLNYGSTTTGTKIPSILVTYDEPLIKRLPTTDFSNGDKHFGGWYLGNKKIDTERYCDLDSYTLTAGWFDTFTVNFYNGNGDIMKSEQVEYGKKATPPTTTPTKAMDNEWIYGKFTSWDKSFENVTSNLDIYPVFEKSERKYTVKLDYGKGTSGTMPKSISVNYNEVILPKLPTTRFSNGSKHFAGWYIGNDLIDTEKYSDLTSDTLTAKWVDTFTVKFYNGNGTVMKTQQVEYDKSATAPTTTPTKAKDNEWIYGKFTGWDKSFENVTSNLDIYPEFEKTQRTYTITLSYGSGASGNMPKSIELTYNEPYANKLPTTDFYNGTKIFDGWRYNTTRIGEQLFSELKATSLTASWIDTYLVTFYDGNGKVLYEERVAKEEAASEPLEIPTKKEDNVYSYEFIGWDKSFSRVTTNLKVYPKFENIKKLYTIALDYGDWLDGLAPETIEVGYNDYLSDGLPSTLKSTSSYVFFKGWALGDELITTEKYSSLTPSSLSAVWLDNTTIITEFQTIISDYTNLNSLSASEKYVLAPVIQAISYALEDALSGIEVTKAYILETPDYKSKISDANKRYTDMTESERKSFPQSIINNFNNDTVKYLADLFDIDIDEYLKT